MAEAVTMPKLAMTQETGTILQWYKSEGDAIGVGEPLLEVMTNKVNVDVESFVDGVLLQKLFDVGAEVPVLDVIAYIGQPGEAPPSHSKSVIQSGPYRATPAARSLARSHGIDLAQVIGSGQLGRIHREDVHAVLQERNAVPGLSPADRKGRNSVLPGAVDDMHAAEPVLVVGLPAAETPAAETDKAARRTSEPGAQERSRPVALSEMRRIIGQRMAQSAFTAPHVTLVLEVDMQAMVDLRLQLMSRIELDTGERLTINTLLLKAVAGVLRSHPNVNATWMSNDQLVEHDAVHLGMAVAVPGGLMVPVIANADRLGLADLTRRAKDVSDRCRNGNVRPQDLENGTFTVSNLGMYEIEEFTPIINQPQVAILGVGSIVNKPVVRDGQVAIRPQMKLSLSFDHRALDGAQAAAFVRDVKHTVESPMSMLVP